MIELSGVSGVQAKIVEFADGLISGGRTSEALKLTIRHAEGEHECETMWPTRDTILFEAALCINEFLGK